MVFSCHSNAVDLARALSPRLSLPIDRLPAYETSVTAKDLTNHKCDHRTQACGRITSEVAVVVPATAVTVSTASRSLPLLWESNKKTIQFRAEKAARLGDKGVTRSGGRRWDAVRPANLRQGPFTAEERRVLMASVAQYTRENNIKNVQDLMTDRKKHRGCWSKIAAALPNRTVRSCFNHCKRTLDSSIRRGKWSAEEIAEMMNQVQKLGTKWRKIGKIIGRDENDVRIKYRRIGESDSSGGRVRREWSPEEDEMLTQLVLKNHKDLAVKRGERTYPRFNILWSAIRDKMSTKRTTSCLKGHWHQTLLGKLELMAFTPEQDLKLVRAVEALDPQAPQDISTHWSKFGLPHSVMQIRDRWEALKSSAISKLPDADKLHFFEIVEKVVASVEGAQKPEVVSTRAALPRGDS